MSTIKELHKYIFPIYFPALPSSSMLPLPPSFLPNATSSSLSPPQFSPPSFLSNAFSSPFLPPQFFPSLLSQFLRLFFFSSYLTSFHFLLSLSYLLPPSSPLILTSSTLFHLFSSYLTFFPIFFSYFTFFHLLPTSSTLILPYCTFFFSYITFFHLLPPSSPLILPSSTFSSSYLTSSLLLSPSSPLILPYLTK